MSMKMDRGVHTCGTKVFDEEIKENMGPCF